MDFSGQTVMRLRSFGRRLGIFPPLVRAFRKISGARYEERFDKALLGAIRTGDVVWDIGANRGFYTEKFLYKVGPGGYVVAFEPSPNNVNALETRFAQQSNVKIYPYALSEKPGSATFYANGDGDGTTDSLIERSAGAVAYQVEVHRGEEFFKIFKPNVLKIDVEGFELEVVRGLGKVLESSTLRSVLIEVHFGILSSRGMPDAPAQLTAILTSAGLAVSWVDSSHMVGERTGNP
jgi:FkbM family methyltransferase